MNSELIIPSEIPWSEIKGEDLEELLYWLFDSMGAKDLEWRIGGRGGGAADQGRDLELNFYTPSPDGALSKQNWWIDAKGRSGTVEPREVHETVLNAAGKSHVDIVVIATNTNFSNPTRDWVKEWQANHPRPIVKLWERTELEGLCSKNPLAVIRLHSRALSPQGKIEVVSAKFWSYSRFSDESILEAIWKEKDEVAIEGRTLLALMASEIANGNMTKRAWASRASDEALMLALSAGLLNFPFLAFRAGEHGVKQEPLVRTIAFLIQIALLRFGGKFTAGLLDYAWNSVEDRDYPEEIRDLILEPILSSMQAELEDVCTDDCVRISGTPRILEDDEIAPYWDRFSLGVDEEPNVEPRHSIRIESNNDSCKVGFDVDKKKSCPLCALDEPHRSVEQFFEIAGKVMRFRIAEKNGI